MALTHKLAVAAAVGCLAAWSIGISLGGKQAAAGPATRPAFEKMFHAPRAVCNQDGEPILTRRAVGHPVVVDFNADGHNDILLGCHRSMDTAAAEILVLLNVGTNKQPRFRWPPRTSVQLEGQPARFSVSCGCKSGGTFELHPVDFNGDGRFDLVVNTYWNPDGVRVLLNTGTSRADPKFTRGKVLHKIGSHGRGSGGGDWNNDGVVDFVFPVNPYGWAVYLGRRGPDGRVTFAEKAALTSGKYTMIAREGAAPNPEGRDSKPRWFDHSPYAWNFSGKHPVGSKKVEIVAVGEDPANKDRPYAEKLSHIDLYVLDHQAKTVTRLGRLATNRAAYTRLSIGDLNGDGCMDLLYTGGVFTTGRDTKIWVMYGKVPNVPGKKTAKARAGTVKAGLE